MDEDNGLTSFISEETQLPKLNEKVIIKTNWAEYVAYFKGDVFLTTEGKEIQKTVVLNWQPMPNFS